MGPIQVNHDARAKVMRQHLRDLFFRTLDRALRNADGRSILGHVLAGHLHRPSLPPIPSEGLARLYPELPLEPQGGNRPDAGRPIFITGRLRSGSTLLWNLFRHVPGVTAYYEPFNERRWFDRFSRGERIDQTHRGVTDYWREYEGLTELGEVYDEDWIDTDLFMDAHAWKPRMERFVRTLIERAKGRAVTQFNRIDFRLPWFRAVFPEAVFVHIYRHPRDQWCSSLLDPTSFPKDGAMPRFSPFDEFYLRRWARDLRYHFPFLDEKQVRHPYELFYYLWKLSYVYGRSYCDHSVAFERLVTSPEVELSSLFEACDLRGLDISALLPIIEQPRLGRWKDYADDAWFREIEARCEATMGRFSAGGLQ
jgi:Sulfotransferase family